MEKKQCTKCKKDLEISLFNLRGGQLAKCCIKCLDNFKKPRQRTKCEHGRQRSKCKDCGRSHICEHNRRRSTCKDCDGGHICEHNKIKSQCKDCGGSQICEHSKIKSRYIIFKYNDVYPITNWGVMEKPFLKQGDTKRYSMFSLKGWEHLDEDVKKPLSRLGAKSSSNYH